MPGTGARPPPPRPALAGAPLWAAGPGRAPRGPCPLFWAQLRRRRGPAPHPSPQPWEGRGRLRRGGGSFVCPRPGPRGLRGPPRRVKRPRVGPGWTNLESLSRSRDRGWGECMCRHLRVQGGTSSSAPPHLHAGPSFSPTHPWAGFPWHAPPFQLLAGSLAPAAPPPTPAPFCTAQGYRDPPRGAGGNWGGGSQVPPLPVECRSTWGGGAWGGLGTLGAARCAAGNPPSAPQHQCVSLGLVLTSPLASCLLFPPCPLSAGSVLGSCRTWGSWKAAS